MIRTSDHRVHHIVSVGRLVATPGVLETFDGHFLGECLKAHCSGDWGIMCADDKLVNDAAVEMRGQVHSAYQDEHLNKVWIITEPGWGTTTILLPEEY